MAQKRERGQYIVALLADSDGRQLPVFGNASAFWRYVKATGMTVVRLDWGGPNYCRAEDVYRELYGVADFSISGY